MGRHNRRPTKDGKIVNSTSVGPKGPSQVVMDRIGLNDNVCMSCNARQDSSLDKCRRCGNKQLRPKAADYRDA